MGTDAELLAACQRGEIVAFAAIVERHQAMVSAIGLSITGDFGLSEDVTQETFVAAWRQLDELREPGKLRAWLAGIARNVAHSIARRRKREVPSDQVDERPSQTPAPRELVLDADTARLVWDALETIPERYRTVLILYYREERSVREVASALELSEDAVNQRLSRGRGHLRDAVAARVTGVLERTRPGAPMVAAILAAIGGQSACADPTSASTSAPTSTGAAADSLQASQGATVGIIAKTAAVLIAAVAVAGVAVVSATRDRGDAPLLETPSAPGDDGTTLSGPAPELPSLAASPSREPAPRSVDYQLSVASPTLAAVDLRGGPSDVYTPEGREAEASGSERRVRGRVVDKRGRPVAGAVILTGERLRQFNHALVGSTGATAAADGRFELAAPTATLTLIAMHRRAGWSRPHALAPGDQPVEAVVLVAEAPAAANGRVTRDDVAADAEVHLATGRLADAALVLQTTTDDDGRYELGPIPAGSYRLRAALRQTMAGGASRYAEIDVALEPGERLDKNIELPGGTMIAVTARAAVERGTVDYILLCGHRQPRDIDAAAAIVRGERDAGHRWQLFGGSDATKIMQFHDVAAGPVTVCVRARDRGGERRQLSFACERVEIDGGDRVVELEL